jgi:hypothetical protein
MDALGPRRYDWPVCSLAFPRELADGLRAGGPAGLARCRAGGPAIGGVASEEAGFQLRLGPPGRDSGAVCTTINGDWLAQSVEILAFG